MIVSGNRLDCVMRDGIAAGLRGLQRKLDAVQLLLLFAIMALCPSARADERSLSEIAEAAASACAKGEWNDAVELYTTLIERDVADPAVLFNLGTAYARSGDVGRGVWMLLRARRLAPRDGMIRDNLTRLAPDVESQIAAFPIFPLELLGGLLSLGEWALLAAAMTMLGGLTWTLVFLARASSPLRPGLRKVALIVSVAAVVAHGFGGVKYYQERLVSRGVIVANNVYPRDTPDESGRAAEFTLKPGTVIQVDSAGVEGWVKAIYGGKNEVFIQRSQMEFL